MMISISSKFHFCYKQTLKASILNSIDRKYRQKINQIKTEQKGKTSHTKKINTVILVDGV